MAKYAKTTSVSISRSKVQIQETFIRYGIDEFGFGTSPRGEGILFKKNGRVFKLNIPNPDPKPLTDKQLEQAKRQRMRVLLLSIKAKLEEIEAGLVSFEDQFLSYMTLPDGSTVGEFMKQEKNVMLLSKSKMPKLLME